MSWQRRSGRHDLPWQHTREPYRVWLSEVMLQQTQAARVLHYWPRFLARFPTLASLAAASLEDVLALWSGLGYYRRAALVHRCAQCVATQHGGEFPRSAKALQALPGIGRSTAAAIAAFCWNERAPILDGNVRRILARVFALDAPSERQLWQLAESLLPQSGPRRPALHPAPAAVQCLPPCRLLRRRCQRCARGLARPHIPPRAAQPHALAAARQHC